MDFGMDGPVVNGWWINPQTGDKINVVDTYFEDNNLLCKTADGRILKYDKIQNYVKTSDTSAPVTPKKQSAPKPSNALPPEVMSELEETGDPTDGLMIPGDNIYGKTNTHMPDAGIVVTREPVKPINDFGIIDRALNSKKSPKASAKIAWDGFPQREVEMLVDVMNISIDDVVEYYINNINVNDLVDEVKSQIRKYIKDHYTASAPTKTTTKKTVKK